MKSVSCSGIPDTRYLASPDFIAATLHWITLIELLILAYGGYCILFKTPKAMCYVKWLILNLHFWSCLSDLMISFIGIPYILFPAPAGYGLGTVDSSKFVLYSMVTLLGAIGASVLAVYENRYFILFGQNSWWENFRKPYMLVIFIMIPFIFLPPFFYIPDQNLAREIVLGTIPCQPIFTFTDRQMFVVGYDLKMVIYSIGFGTWLLTSSIIIFGVLTFWNLWKSAYKHRFSTRTRHAQTLFAIALTLQSVFMVSIVLAPVLTIFWIIENWHHDQALNSFVFIVLSFHGVGSTIMMIFAHKPYRDFTISKMCPLPQNQKQMENYKNNNIATSVI